MNTTPEDEFESAIGQAVAIWRSGRAIPPHLITALVEDGFDVPSLEAFHRSR